MMILALTEQSEPASRRLGGENGSQIFTRISGAMPSPESVTTSRNQPARSGSRPVSTWMC